VSLTRELRFPDLRVSVLHDAAVHEIGVKPYGAGKVSCKSGFGRGIERIDVSRPEIAMRPKIDPINAVGLTGNRGPLALTRCPDERFE
jgi:hypothetical protein